MWAYSRHIRQVADREPVDFSFSVMAFVSVCTDESPETLVFSWILPLKLLLNSSKSSLGSTVQQCLFLIPTCQNRTVNTSLQLPLPACRALCDICGKTLLLLFVGKNLKLVLSCMFSSYARSLRVLHKDMARVCTLLLEELCFSCLSCHPTGLPISTYAKFCHRKLLKVAITGGKKVSWKLEQSKYISRADDTNLTDQYETCDSLRSHPSRHHAERHNYRHTDTVTGRGINTGSVIAPARCNHTSKQLQT